MVVSIIVLSLVVQITCKKQLITPLTDTSFDKALKRHERVLVNFYAPCIRHPETQEGAPWCKRVEASLPEFTKAAELLQMEKLKTRITEVDVVEQKALATRFKLALNDPEKLPDLPYLYYFVQGKYLAKYRGLQQAAPVVEWLRLRETHAVMELSETEVDAYVKSTPPDQFTIIARAKKKTERWSAFWMVVDGLLRFEASLFRMAVVALPKDADANRDASLTMWRPGFGQPDAKKVKYSGPWDDLSIQSWAKKRSYPSIGFAFSSLKYGQVALQEAGLHAVVVAILDDDEKTAPAQQRVVDALRSLVSTYQTWRFVVTTRSSLDRSAMLMLDVRESSTSMLVVVRDKRRYAIEDVTSMEDPQIIAQFLKNVKDKKATPRFRSDAPPAMSHVEGVLQLVGDTFNDVIMSPQKDVLVGFSSADCERCSTLDSLLVGLAAKASEKGWDQLGLVISRMDTDKNECFEDTVAGRPKLVLYPAVNKEQKIELRHVYPERSSAYELTALEGFLMDHARGVKFNGTRAEL